MGSARARAGFQEFYALLAQVEVPGATRLFAARRESRLVDRLRAVPWLREVVLTGSPDSLPPPPPPPALERYRSLVHEALAAVAEASEARRAERRELKRAKTERKRMRDELRETKRLRREAQVAAALPASTDGAELEEGTLLAADPGGNSD